MIFSPKLARQVAAGKKTQTRRLVKPDETRCRYRIGRAYAVQPGRGKASIARIEILAVKKEEIGELTFEEARAEGFRTRDDFFTYWIELHGSLDPHVEVWAIAFRLNGGSG